MSFEEKSTWLVLVATLIVYGGYFVDLLMEARTTPVELIEYQPIMLGTVVALVVLIIIGYVLVYAIAPDTEDSSDERDRAINRHGDYIGSFVLAAGALTAMGMAMAELAHFWIANTLLLALVVGEVIAGIIKVVLYRRGMAGV